MNGKREDGAGDHGVPAKVRTRRAAVRGAKVTPPAVARDPLDSQPSEWPPPVAGLFSGDDPHLPEEELDKLPDEVLAHLHNLGSDHAFEAIYNRHSEKLFACCLRRLHSREDAEDVRAHTFAKIYESRACLHAGRAADPNTDGPRGRKGRGGITPFDANRGPGSFRRWMYTIAMNKLRDIIKLRKHFGSLDELPAGVELVSNDRPGMHDDETESKRSRRRHGGKQ